MADAADLEALVEQPFELLQEMERRSRAAHAGHGAGAAPEEWVGVGFRIGEEHFVANRDQVREVLMLPEGMTRVPGAKRWLLGTHAGAIKPQHLQAYLDEFVFRHNRRGHAGQGDILYPGCEPKHAAHQAGHDQEHSRQ